jgi:hypothetical protein
LTPVTVPQSVQRSEAARPPQGALTLPASGKAEFAPYGNNYNTVAAPGGEKLDSKADEFGYGVGAKTRGHTHTPSDVSANANTRGDDFVPAAIPRPGRRPGSAAGGTNRFTVTNLHPDDIQSPEQPAQHLPSTNTVTNEPPAAKAYMSAAEEKKLYEQARSRVERTQGIGKVITPVWHLLTSPDDVLLTFFLSFYL